MYDVYCLIVLFFVTFSHSLLSCCIKCSYFMSLGDMVALRVERRTSDREIASSTPTQPMLRNNLRQVVHTPSAYRQAV